MDGLEHWNLRRTFTGEQAALLAAGTDPYTACLGPNFQGWPESACFILREMLLAFQVAKGVFLDGGDAPSEGVSELSERFRRGPNLSRMLRSDLMLAVVRDAESNKEPRAGADAGNDAVRNQVVELRRRLLDSCRDERFEDATFTNGELLRWFAASNFTPKFEFAAPVAAPPDPPDQSTDKPSPSERPLTTTERGTLLKLIAVLAAKGYGIDPKATRLDGIGSIVTDAQTLGVDMTDDTIRAKLREAFKLI